MFYMSETLLDDYSNLILSVDLEKSTLYTHKLSLRDKFYEYNKIEKANQEIINKLSNNV